MYAKRIGARDTVPAMLEPGEAVLNKGAAKAVGKPAINKLNARGRKVMGYAEGTSEVLPYEQQKVVDRVAAELVKAGIDPDEAAGSAHDAMTDAYYAGEEMTEEAILARTQDGGVNSRRGRDYPLFSKDVKIDKGYDQFNQQFDAQGRVKQFQGGGIVPGPGNIGYVGTEEQDPRWADIELRAPGVNISALKQKAAQNGISPEAIKGIMSLFQKGAGNAYAGGGRGGSSLGNTGVPEAWWANAQGYQGGTSRVGPAGYTRIPTFGYVPNEDVSYYSGNSQPGGLEPLDLPAATGPGSNPTGGYADLPPYYYGSDWRGNLPSWARFNGQPQPANVPMGIESPASAAPVDIGNTISGDEDYPSGRGLSPTSVYPAGRGLLPSTAPQTSGTLLSRLFGNVRGQFPSDLGGMTNPEQATQNARYWSGINGPGLSNPAFYPGSGSSPGTSGLNTPGGVPFDPSGGDLSMLPSGFTHGTGPLSPVNYGAFLYPAGMNKPSYASYLAQYPQAIQSGPLFGGSAGRIPVSAK